MSQWPYPTQQRLIVGLQSACYVFDQQLGVHNLEPEIKLAILRYLVGAYFVSKEEWVTDSQVDVARAYLRDVTRISEEEAVQVQTAVSDEIARCIVSVIADFGGNNRVGTTFTMLSEHAVVVTLG